MRRLWSKVSSNALNQDHLSNTRSRLGDRKELSMILVTGGAGYIGSVTVELLLQRGEQVVILDNLSRGHSETIARDIPFYQGNAGNRDLVARIANEHGIEACIHFAALAYVGESVA